MKSVPPFPFSFCPPLTAAATANVTNSVFKDHRGPFECVVMLIVSQQCDWMGSHEAAEAVHPLTFDLYLSSLCVCVCVLGVWNEQTPWGSSAVYPPSVSPRLPLNTYRQSTHTHQMLACQYKGAHGGLHTNTRTQTDTLHSRGHATLHRTLSLSGFQL